MNEHVTSVERTDDVRRPYRLTSYRAVCSCGWRHGWSTPVKHLAESDAEEHAAALAARPADDPTPGLDAAVEIAADALDDYDLASSVYSGDEVAHIVVTALARAGFLHDPDGVP